MCWSHRGGRFPGATPPGRSTGRGGTMRLSLRLSCSRGKPLVEELRAALERSPPESEPQPDLARQRPAVAHAVLDADAQLDHDPSAGS